MTSTPRRTGAGWSRARPNKTGSASRRPTSSCRARLRFRTHPRRSRRCKRAPFAQHPFWVTRSNEGELYAAGDYPFQGKVGDGLTAYTSSPENVSGKDLVVWYTAGFTHVPEPEDYPVMTTEIVGFELLPSGFFDRNPALDAPEQR